MTEEWTKIILTNDQFANSIMKLVELIRPHKDKYKFVYGIPRGGLIVAVWIAHQLEIEFISDVDLERLGPNSQILIADDIADTGVTLENYKYLSSDMATVYYKPRSIIKPIYYAEITNDWIVFPYEKTDEVPNREVIKSDEFREISKTFNIIEDNQLCSAELSHFIIDLDIPSVNLNQPIYYFNRLIVPPKVRNRGISKLLLQQVADWADQEKINIINEINPYGNLTLNHLIHLYKKYGFTLIRKNLMIRKYKEIIKYEEIIKDVNKTT